MYASYISIRQPGAAYAPNSSGESENRAMNALVRLLSPVVAIGSLSTGCEYPAHKDCVRKVPAECAGVKAVRPPSCSGCLNIQDLSQRSRC